MSSPRMTAALVGAVLALAASDAWAGPCTSDIADFEAAIARSQGNPLAGLFAPQSVGAQLSHEPTPFREKASRLKSRFAAAMAVHVDAQPLGCTASPRPNECMFCKQTSGDRILQMNPGQSRATMSNFAFLAAEFPAVDEAAVLMPLLSEVARVQSVCVHAVNASLPTDRFAAAH